MVLVLVPWLVDPNQPASLKHRLVELDRQTVKQTTHSTKGSAGYTDGRMPSMCFMKSKRELQFVLRTSYYITALANLCRHLSGLINRQLCTPHILRFNNVLNIHRHDNILTHLTALYNFKLPSHIISLYLYIQLTFKVWNSYCYGIRGVKPCY